MFGECVRAAKKRSLRVYAGMSPDIQWMDPELVKVHPLWSRRHPDESIQSSAPNIGWTCVFREHYSKQQPAIMRELNARDEIDGVYMNGWPLIQVCYCDTCRKIGDPRSTGYRAAVMNRVDEMIRLYKSVVLEKSTNNFYSCNLGGGLKESALDQWRLTRDALWYTADNQVRSAVVAPVWQDASQVKFARALMCDCTVASITAAYTRAGSVAWRQVSDTSWEPLCRMTQTAAAGATVWYHWLGLEQGFGQDRRWQQHGRDFMQWHAKNDVHFHNKRSLAKVAVIASSRSVTMYKAPYKDDRTDHLKGMYASLVEARIPFDFVHEEDLNPKRLSQYSVLVLPNVALLSNAQTEALQEFAASGGSLLATFQTPLPLPRRSRAERICFSHKSICPCDEVLHVWCVRVSAVVLPPSELSIQQAVVYRRKRYVMIIVGKPRTLGPEKLEHGLGRNRGHKAALLVQPVSIATLWNAIADEREARCAERNQVMRVHGQIAWTLCTRPGFRSSILQEVAGHPVVLAGREVFN